MSAVKLCRPAGPCDDRNRCYRYRAIPETNSTLVDWTQYGGPKPGQKCPGYLAPFDHDVLMPEDWQERGIGSLDPCTD